MYKVFIVIGFSFLLSSCLETYNWPEASVIEYSVDENVNNINDIDSIKKILVGHYAHYDVVAYEDTTTKTTMRTFIISYGFTDFFIEDNKLMQSNRFLYSVQKLNQKDVISNISKEAVQAIKPKVQEVKLEYKNNVWDIYRPASPTLLGVKGDPLKPLPKIHNDTNFLDPDFDGNPGVTVTIEIGKFLKGEIYITRREIFEYHLTLNKDGSLTGFVDDYSEQFVIDASMKILKQPSNAFQYKDKRLSPIILIPINNEIDSLEEFMKIRDSIFPKEPSFY